MPALFSVTSAELSLEAPFRSPCFDVLQSKATMAQRLYEALSLSGLRLSDMKWEGRSGSIADIRLRAYLLDYTMTVRISPERLHISCSQIYQNQVDQISEIIAHALRAVSPMAGVDSFPSYAVAVALHGSLPDLSPTEFLEPYRGRVPEGMGEVAGNGCVFYFASGPRTLLSSLTLDQSAVVANGLLVRLHAVFNGATTTPADVVSAAREFVREGLRSVDLELVRE